MRLHVPLRQTDAAFSKFVASMPPFDEHKFTSLKTLKLREIRLSDAAIKQMISWFPNLKRLDLSFTSIRRPSSLALASVVPTLEKLSVTSTGIAISELVPIISALLQLKTLSLGALGGGHASSAAMGNSSAMTMNDETLIALTDVLENLPYLENVSLVGNTKLGSTGRGEVAISDFISRVGRKCKVWNFDYYN
jgi:hypothetical protein